MGYAIDAGYKEQTAGKRYWEPGGWAEVEHILLTSGGLPSWLGFCVVTSQLGEARATCSHWAWGVQELDSADLSLSVAAHYLGELGQVTLFF